MSVPPYLEIKLQPASTDAWQLERPRLCELVMQASGVRLVLVRAPAGYGKTTAMVQLRRSCERAGLATAWLTLDAADNDMARFLMCLNHAVRRLPGLSDKPTQQEAPPVARLAHCVKPFALFLDEMEAIQNPAVLDWLQQLIDQLPPHGKVVIGSRSQPALRLARWRARRQLVDIDPAALRFSLQEARDLLRSQGHLALDSTDVQRVYESTEGWIAGLWLASMALEGRASKGEFIDRLSATSAVADYLMDEVFQQQSDAVQEFLLRTSVLKTLTPELCRALVGEGDCNGLLRQLSQHNVMLTPIDRGAGGYRYHSLFAAFLQEQLGRRGHHHTAALHRAAARWFEEQDRPVPAMDHHLAAGDVPAAVTLLSTHVLSLLFQGRVRLLARWFAALPAATLDAHPRLRVAEAWAICFTRGPSEALQRVAQDNLASSTDPQVWPLVSALRPCALAMMGRYDDALASGRLALTRLPSTVALADQALINVMTNALMVKGEMAESLQLARAPLLAAAPAGVLNSMYAASMEGVMDWLEGRVHEAHSRFRLALANSCIGDHGLTYGNAWPGVLHACTAYERNDTASASELLRSYLPIARDLGLSDHMILGYRMLSRLAFDAGDADECLHLLAELEQLGQQRMLHRVIASARLERARVQLLQGRLQEARTELERADNDDVWRAVAQLRLIANDCDDLLLGRLRWEALAGDARHASQRLARAAAEAAAGQRLRRETALRLVQALALVRAQGEEAASGFLAQVLRRCAAQGMVRLVLDEGPPMARLIAGLVPQAADDAFGAYLHSLHQAFASHAPRAEPAEAARPTSAAAADPVPVEPLTAKEIQVLAMLAHGFSNAAISEKLFISDSTVRTHLRNINAKLCAASRTQAVSVGRRLGLVR